jgi:hypothetical protein
MQQTMNDAERAEGGLALKVLTLCILGVGGILALPALIFTVTAGCLLLGGVECMLKIRGK